MKRACVVVLGDVGRSPRIRNQALSLAEFMTVDLIGYSGGANPTHRNLRVSPVTPYPGEVAPAALNYLVKIVWQIVGLTMLLLSEKRYDYVLCQNPPAIPALLVCWLYCLAFRSEFVIDWHNYGHSIMALKHGKESRLVRVAAAIEYYCGRKARHNFCVSEAMKNDLLQNHDIRCKLLYDRPSEVFRPIDPEEKHSFIMELCKKYPEFALERPSADVESNAITQRNDKGEVSLRERRPGILFSSTSWTLDEDFEILLDALEDYDEFCIESKRLPDLVCVITGKGPMKDHYSEMIAKRRLKRVKFVTPWLETSEYPLMVASADLGVCLHTSSSGLDLPMKIVDMFGAGLPVCAYKYPCLNELVKEGQNGYMFENAKELGQLVRNWFLDFPKNSTQNKVVEKFKENLKVFREQNWDINWRNRAKPVFDRS